ncbi:MAG TPA: trigger factor [Longimicrobiales bacterium]
MTLPSSDLKIAVEKPRTWARRLTITVPAERVRHEREAVARRLAGRIKIPGFRRGKVPAQVLERKYGPAIEQEAIERVVGAAYREALEREQLHPITQGEVEDVNYAAGSDLTFNVEFEIRPEIELERLGGFRIEREKPEVADAEVDRVIEGLREREAVWHPLETGAPADGDMVVVEITPLAEAEGAPAAEPRQYRIVLGREEAAPAVEAAIRTLEAGQEGEFTLEIPPPDAEEGSAREQRVRIRMLEAKRPELPAVDDEFARSVGDFEDLEALRARIRADLEKEAEAEAERSVRHRLLEAILEANPFEVPDALVNQYLERIIRPREDADPERVAEMRRLARPAAEGALRRMMVIERVAEMEGLRATSAELDARVEDLAARHDRPVGEVWAQLQRSGQLSALEEEVTEDKVFEYLKSLSTIE